MKREEMTTSTGRKIVVLTPENEADRAEVQRLYDEGKTQIGDSVKAPKKT